MACCAFERDVYYWSSAKGQLYISAIIIIHSTNCEVCVELCRKEMMGNINL